MEVILVRHTAPKIAKGICYGQTDLDLCNSFPEELQAIRNIVPINDPSIVYYTSPLKRCVLLAQELNPKVIFDNRLKELNFGDWELKNWNDIDKKVLDPWMEDFVHTPATNGESYIDLQKRTVNFLEELREKKQKTSVVVTHAGVIRSMWAYVNHIPLEKSFDLKLSYGAVIKLTI